MAAILVGAAAALAGQSTPLWRHTATAPISFFRVTPLGNVVVATADGLVGLDPDSGTVIWTRDDLKNVDPSSYAAVRQSPFATVKIGGRVELLDLVTGATKWRTAPSAEWEPYLQVPERGLLLLYASTDSLEHVLVALELETGAVRWERALPFELDLHAVDEDPVGLPPVLWASDSTFVLDTPNHGAALVHARTGAWLWRSDRLAGRLLGLGSRDRIMLLADSVMYVAFENKLQALSIRDGTRLWDEAHSFPWPVAQVELTTWGLVVRGQRGSLDVIDPATGTTCWSKRFRSLMEPLGVEDVTPFVVGEDRVYVAARKKLVALDLEYGTATEMAALKFKGDERPFLLERRSDGLLLIGNQNLILLDSTGAEHYHAYHPAPGRSTLEKVGLGTLAVLANAAAFAVSAVSTMDPDSPLFPLPTRSGDDPEFWLPDLGARYAASEQARNYVYSVAHEEDSTGHKRPAFLRLHKDDGRVVGRVWLEEKRPDYQLDHVTGVLYVRDGREILAFRM